MKAKTNIGLLKSQSDNLARKLNELLADYMMFYQNTRGLHWNIKGDKFFELHVKFEELYTNLLLKVDEIAEIILTLSHLPFHSFSDYEKQQDIKPFKNITDGKKGLENIVSTFEMILLKQRELLISSANANDEGTNALMSDYISEQEKLVWMYSSYHGK